MKFEKWSFGYWVLKQYVIFADWIIHKKVLVTGKENIPKNKPVIFAPNHQNALSDPMAILLHTPYQPVWLARADIFKIKTVRWILHFLKMIPVYRIRDGKENLGRNDETFDISVRVLENNAALALFPEAAHSGRRQMLPHKKAVPRIAFMAEEKSGFNLDIHIIPTGIHYSHYWKFNRTIIVNYGQPVRVKPYLDEYLRNQGAAVNRLKDDLHQAILPLVINIKSKQHYTEFEFIRKFYGDRYLSFQDNGSDEISRFRSDQRLVNQLNELESMDPGKASLIAEKASDYCNQAKKFRLKSHDPEKVIKRDKSVKALALLLAGLPFFIYGFAFNALPFFIIDRTIRNKVKDRTFWSSFFLLSGLILFPLFYLILLILLAPLFLGFWLKILFLVSLPFAGKIAFNWYLLMHKTIRRIRFAWRKKKYPEEYHQLVELKKELFALLDQLARPVFSARA